MSSASERVYAGVDLGGTKIAAALGTADGRILAEGEVPTLSYGGSDAVLVRMAGLLNDLAKQVGRAPQAVGVGVPGTVDLGEGIIRFLPNVPGHWPDVPVRATLSPLVGGVPVYLLNDARMATLGELAYGQGRGVSTMVFFTLGTGIGGGVVVDGKLRLGALGSAGELGHMTILPDGPVCACGNPGCLETLASGPAITGQGVWLMRCGRAPHLYDLVEGNADRVSPAEMVAAAKAGDDSVHDVLIRAFSYLGIGIANQVVTLHPELIVLGGGMAAIGDLLFDTVRAVVKRRVGMFPPDDVRIEPSVLGSQAGIYGGIALAAQGGQV